MDENKFVIEGFEFSTQEEYNIAQNELNGIKFFFKKYNMKDPKVALKVYNSSIEKNLFKTQVGINFLYELQKKLKKSSVIDQKTIKPIKTTVKNAKPENKDGDKLKENLKLSIGINLFLVIAVIIMIFVATTSNNVNIINYEARIQDKYSSWESQLKEREKAVSEKESELNINNN